MNLQRFSLGPLGTNCYIVFDEDKNALIFDPGAEAERLIQFMSENNLKPHAILLTHAHFDHIGAVDALRKHYEIDVYLHEEEKEWLTEPELNRSVLSLPESISTEAPNHLLVPGELVIGPFQLQVIHTPGHSPGSVTFIFHDYGFIISGDVLFQQGVGRTDLPGGSFEVLVHSIQEKLYQLPDNFRVFSGHGEETNIGYEKQFNPFVSE
ncbi:MBL fold metallo-hydrolase [Ornithinibacillus sp. 4-3]|uniref:MBL fold metallo-hydrolase n=1 Tax=Ornithinibacillus sp. 4-3 TaxID=3231488 RepID=A0AB39HLA8_9BACI